MSTLVRNAPHSVGSKKWDRFAFTVRESLGDWVPVPYEVTVPTVRSVLSRRGLFEVVQQGPVIWVRSAEED